jgi:aldehyde dehydrogenase (NAD+)
MSHQIPDDPSVIQPIFSELKKNFLTHETKSTAFRKAAIKRLLEGYCAMEKDFNAALKIDLGLNEFICEIGAHAIINAELKDLIDNVASWNKPESVSTPLGKNESIFRPGNGQMRDLA